MEKNSEELDTWVTVHRMEVLMEAQLLKVKMEFEGIEVQILDGLTSEIAAFSSKATGGIRIQVRESQKEKALSFLLKEGYIRQPRNKPHKFVEWMDALAKRIPILKNKRIEVRFLVVTSVLLLMIVLPFAISSIPTLSDQLIAGNWCIEKVTYNDKLVVPDDSFVLSLNGCSETLSFSDDGRLRMSSYLDVMETGAWNEYKDGIFIHISNRFGGPKSMNIFDGAYSVDLENDRLELKSSTTRIICGRIRW